MDRLRNDMEDLLMELSDLSRQNDELLSAKDNDMLVIRDLDGQLKEYKRKYEQAKTELRSVKGACLFYSLYDRANRVGGGSNFPVIPTGPQI